MALEGWTGLHGEGKTYSAFGHVLGQWDRHGIPLVTNVIVAGYVEVDAWLDAIGAYLDAAAGGCDVPADQVPVPPVLHFETWDDLMAALEAAIALRLRLQVLVDEAGKLLSSRFYSKMDPRVLMVLQERRKIGAGLDLYWTAPSFEHVDKILRDVTQVVHVCRRWGGSEYSHDGGRAPWAFWVRSYRPEQVTKAKRKAIRRQLHPFSRELAGMYTTGIVSMARPMADEVAARPDYRDPPAEKPAAQVHVLPIPAKARRR